MPGRGPREAVSERHEGDPLRGVERVLVDGSNLAYALGRGTARGRSTAPGGPAGGPGGPGSGPGGAPGGPGGGPAPLPKAGILASIRAAFPVTVRVELVFDGNDDVGIARAGTLARAAQNLFVEHTGRRSGDRVIEASVEAQLRADGPAATWGILVVTDDRELRGLVQAKGARVAGTAWLAGRLARAAAGVGAGRSASGTSIGQRRPPRRPA
jgi:hypothetical protein